MALIVHVTESLGGGVLYSIAQLAKAQAKSDLEVILVHSRRPDTPSESDLQSIFPFPIQRLELSMSQKVAPFRDLLSILHLRRLLKSLSPDVVHLHSSKAGVLGRLAVASIGVACQVVYSPRGFSFLRVDVPIYKRNLFLYIERFMSKFPGVLVACSESEAALARERLGHPNVKLIENSIDIPRMNSLADRKNARLRVVTSGRLTYAKAPWRFRNLAISLTHEPIDFIWIGGGEGIDSDWRLVKEDVAREDNYYADYNWLPDGSEATLTITGWISRENVLKELASADIFVMTSLWEGMPLSLIEAQVFGLPAVVPDVVGCRDVVRHGITGYIYGSDEHLVHYVRDLIGSSELRRQLGRQAHKSGADRFSIWRMHKEMLQIYGLL